MGQNIASSVKAGGDQNIASTVEHGRGQNIASSVQPSVGQNIASCVQSGMGRNIASSVQPDGGQNIASSVKAGVSKMSRCEIPAKNWRRLVQDLFSCRLMVKQKRDHQQIWYRHGSARVKLRVSRCSCPHCFDVLTSHVAKPRRSPWCRPKVFFLKSSTPN